MSQRAIVAVDVLTEIVITRPATVVAAYAADPSNAPAWYENITSVTWETGAPLQVGSRIAFTARFLGRRLAYTYETTDFSPAERLVMRAAQGPFPMETTYTWQAIDDRSTRMTLRNRGEPTGFSKLTAPLMAIAMRSANRKDLRTLRAILQAA
jgi:Polyketide cyclase / dehydrase and lipid transport